MPLTAQHLPWVWDTAAQKACISTHAQSSPKVCAPLSLQTDSIAIKDLPRKGGDKLPLRHGLTTASLGSETQTHLSAAWRVRACHPSGQSSHSFHLGGFAQKWDRKREAGTCSRCCSPAELLSLLSTEGAQENTSHHYAAAAGCTDRVGLGPSLGPAAAPRTSDVAKPLLLQVPHPFPFQLLCWRSSTHDLGPQQHSEAHCPAGCRARSVESVAFSSMGGWWQRCVSSTYMYFSRKICSNSGNFWFAVVLDWHLERRRSFCRGNRGRSEPLQESYSLR